MSVAPIYGQRIEADDARRIIGAEVAFAGRSQTPGNPRAEHHHRNAQPGANQ